MAYTNIDDPSAYFQTATYSGTGSSGNAITNDGNSDLQPDFVWIKVRTYNNEHMLQDSSRGFAGSGEVNVLKSNTTAVEGTNGAFASFDTNGFEVGGTNAASRAYNGSSDTYAAWQWKANGGTTSSNTDGTGITSTVQANTDAGFSIVTYTGIGSGNANPSVGHGLGVTPQVVLVKGRSQANSWVIYHYGIDGANSRNKYLLLNTADAAGTLANYWGTSASGGVTSSTFGVYADNQSANNYLNGTHVAYCFAEKQGYSKFSNYVGNGTANNGPFIYTGFKPALIMIKSTAATGATYLWDTKRDPFNGAYATVNAAEADAETSNTIMTIDVLSNGFKIKNTGANNGTNQSGTKYVYYAFAENPFTTSTGIPTTAR